MRAWATFLHSRKDDVLLALSLSIAGIVGFLGGLTAAFVAEARASPPVIVRGSGGTVASVTFEGFRDGALRGHAVGPLRLYMQDDAVTIAPDGTFALTRPAFWIEEVTIIVPPGMRFVASKKGKKYYPVESSGGERIVPENRRYFPDEAAAHAAGFTR